MSQTGLPVERCAAGIPHEPHDYPLRDPNWTGDPAWHCPGIAKRHDCQHPVDDYLPGGGDIWTCPDCGRVWEAHAHIYWAPVVED